MHGHLDSEGSRAYQSRPGRAGRQAVQIMHIARVLERICAGNATVRRSRSPDCPVGGQRNSEVVK